MNKRILSVFALLFLPLIVLVQCQFETPKPQQSDNEVSYRKVAGFAEDKTYSKATLDDKFAEDRVVIILNKAESFKFKAYTPKDFPEIDCRVVTDSTAFGMEIVKQQIEAEKTKNWSKLKERIETGMLMDVDNFRRILDLHLTVKSKENVLKAIKLLEKRDDVLYAGPYYYMELCALPSPTPAYLSNQMAALNSASLPSAWDIVVGNSYTPQWNSLKVGVLDSGILATHPALADRIDQTLSRDFTTGSTTGIPGGLQDPYGHGTHVAGIIGANGTGVTGACWGVSLVSLRVFNDVGSLENYASRVRYAVDFARNNNIPILNYSGRVLSNYTGFNDLYAAIQQYPGLFVCSAGNNNPNSNDIAPCYPTNWTVNLPNLISVGAINNSDNRASFSNWGATTVDLFAPGGVGNGSPGPGDIYSTYKNNDYAYDYGTSMAAPHVAGIAALVKALHPYMTAPELKTALRNSVDVLPQLTGKCNTGGKINAYKAVNYIPIVGSVDVNFMGSTTIVNGSPLQTATGTPVGNVLMGKFHLFTNGDWALVEMGKLSNPIVNFKAWDYPQSIAFGSIPQGIKTYITNSGIGTISSGFRIFLPTRAYPNESYYYWDFDFYFTMSTTGVKVEQWGRCYRNEQLLANDQRKIKVQNFSGSI